MTFDIIIVGGGLVGASLACALKDQPLKIALIERNQLSSTPLFPTSQINDARALALSLPSIQCLEMIHVWQKLKKLAEPIHEVHVSKQHYFGVTRIKASEYDLPSLGYVVNADHLNNALQETLSTLTNLTIFSPDEITDLKISTDEKFMDVHLASQKILQASLCVAADGAESFLRKIAGIAAKIQDYQQTAIVTNVLLKQSHLGVAYERFTEEGSIALLPLPDNWVKCVLVVPTNHLPTVQSLSDEAFLGKIQQDFGQRLGDFSQIGRRIYYPLKSSHSETLYDHRLVLIGNGANQFHPIAAQGFNLGLRDAATLAELSVTAKSRQQDIGSIERLQQYAAARQTDHQSIRSFINRLTEPNLLQWLGIVGAEWVAPIKKGIAVRALGKLTPLPKLCRGLSLG